MKFFESVGLAALATVLASATMLGQDTSTTSSTLDTSTIAAELKKLQTQVAQQAEQIQKLQQQLASKQDVASTSDDASPRLINANLSTSVINPSSRPASYTRQEGEKKESPLSFRIGGAEFTPGGFVDFENIFRTTNTGNVSSTNYTNFPFSNTAAGHLTEFRSTGQYSRFNIKVTSRFGQNDVTGYVEFDFNGNDPANVFVTTNPHTNRLRLYWLDLKRGKWEFLGGQTWGLFTANRVGVSPNPADVFQPYGEDGNVHVGDGYTRASEFRAAYHFNDHVVLAAGIANPQQFIGADEVLFPNAFSAQLARQFDNGANSGAPNLAPDFVSKLALDSNPTGRNFHFELGGLLTSAKITVLPVTTETTTNPTFQSHSAIGGGLLTGVSLDLLKDSEGRFLRFVGYGHWGDGIGRYLLGLGPTAVVVPVQTGVDTFDARVSMVHGGDAITGFEFAPCRKTLFGAYYGGAYFQRNAFVDITKSTMPVIGFGGSNSSSVANRSVQEATFDWNQYFWRSPQYGALTLISQTSYLTRSPWFVASGAPKNAHLVMSYLSLRYVLP